MPEVIDEITANNRKFMDLLKRGDAAGIARLYTPDAQLLPPDSPIIAGAAGIQTFWQGAMNNGVKAAVLETVSVDSRADLAYEVGKFVLHIQSGSQQMTVPGKYVVVWKNSGGWKLHIDTWNTGAS